MTAINEARYQWAVRMFERLRDRLAINIKVHDPDQHLQAGQIYLFNHFARFETVIPQYFIYKATGAYCRCVASRGLFAGNGNFAKWLWSLGAVPNDHPGLLAFLAAEILRGRRVIVFPEGGMIKDRRVVDAAGDYAILSPEALTLRKHHQGAAATALTLEIFKKRILSVHQAGDEARLMRWVRAVGLPSLDALLAAARLPTLIVPANITFFPLHISDNILRRGAELFNQDLSDRAREELLVEGNLLLKRTDMDIRVGEPIHPRLAWNLPKRLLLNQAFSRIDSLEDLFALRDNSPRLLERMVATALRRETERVRDQGMERMYALTTVNLGHLASRLILALMAAGTSEIERRRFHLILYLAFQGLQREFGVHLHRGLKEPDAYDGIYSGSCPLWDHFLETATAAGLIEASATHYRFLPKILETLGARDPRLANIIQVYDNESSPIAAVRRAVEQAITVAAQEHDAALARALFADEVRAYQWCKDYFSDPRYAPVNAQETATESGRPLLWEPHPARPLGVVLVHGFLSSPAELAGFGARLAALGYPTLAVRLKGHGTSPQDLLERSWRDWLDSVRRGAEIMALLAKRFCVIGFSTGGALSLLLAAEELAGLAGVVPVAAPVRFRSRVLSLAPAAHGLHRLTGIKPFILNESEHPEINYRNIPLRSLVELRAATAMLRQRLKRVTCPALVLQGTDDPTVDPRSAALIYDALGSRQKDLRMIPSARHGILIEDVGETQSTIIAFLNSLS